VSAGNYYWNSGMFMFRAKDVLKETEERKPKILQHGRAALENAQADLDFVRLDAAAFEK